MPHTLDCPICGREHEPHADDAMADIAAAIAAGAYCCTCCREDNTPVDETERTAG